MNGIVQPQFSITEDGNYEFHQCMRPEEIVSIAINAIQCAFSRGEVFETPCTVKEFAVLHLAQLQQEVFACMFLDNKHRLISFDKLFYGTINSASVHPREIVRQVFEYNAAAIICAHNHPSGDAEPSQADKRITKRIKAALELIDVHVLDHIVVASDGSTVSFKEWGLM